MKTLKLTFIALAAAAMLFAGCKKDDEKKTDNNGNNNPAVTLNNNELVVDGVHYALVSSASDYGDGLQFSAYNQEVPDMFSFSGNIYSGAYNHTYNVAVHNAGVHYGFDFYANTVRNPDLFNVSYDNWNEGIHGALGEQGYENESVFSSGTADIRYNDDGLTFMVNGTLKNNHTFAFKVVVPKDDILMTK